MSPRKKAPAAPPVMDIIRAMESPLVFRPLFKDLGSWHAWEVYLRALFGLRISDAADLELLRACTELEARPTERIRESFVICGRRSGKSFMSAIIASYLAAFKDWRPYLSPGERGWVFIVAVDKPQAGIIKNYISGIFGGNATLRALVKQETKEALELRNGVSIAVKTCSFRTLRGYTVLCAILEEMAFWRSEETGANPDREVLAALRPALATVPESLLIGISTPFSRQGVLWDQYRQHYGKRGGPLVWRAPTRIMNPTIDGKRIEDDMAADRAAARAEWEAEWREDLEAFLSADALDAVVAAGRGELPPMRGASYSAAVDPSGGRGDAMVLSVVHAEKENVVQDCLRIVRPPFNPADVVGEFARSLKEYGIKELIGDRYSGAWCSSAFEREGIFYRNAEHSAAEAYLEFLPIVMRRGCELLDHRQMLAEFRALLRRTGRGRDIVDHPPSGHDDIANATALSVVAAAASAAGGVPIATMDLDVSPDDGQGAEDYWAMNVFKGIAQGKLK